jgi:cytochrome c oxidase subunit 2
MATGRNAGGLGRWRDGARRCAAVACVLLALAGCAGEQSALSPAGYEAASVLFLFRVMLAGAAAIWLAVVAGALYAAHPHRRGHGIRVGRAVILGGGIAVPVVLLTALLVPSLAMIPALRAPADDPLRIEVSGEQWWWRVTYRLPGEPPVAAANEVRLPRGRRVELALTSPDVIHSFWIPSLAGKLDMIPGRTNRLVLEPTQAGRFRGVCAEFCGLAHALMAFTVTVLEPEAFGRWLAAQRTPAAAPGDERQRRGARLFQELGCGGCHTVRGTPAEGKIGPDLTHLADRATLGAGILANDHASRIRWIATAETIKPGVRMPSFGMLPAEDLDALAAWLGSLQ